MKRAAAWGFGGALLAAAVAVVAVTPSDLDVLAPFPARAALGEVAEARTLHAEVVDAVVADELVSADGDWTASGTWLVVTVAAQAPRTEERAAIEMATLRIGDETFQATERTRSLLHESLHVGTEVSGTLAFEIPSDLHAEVAELRLMTEYSTPRLDDVVMIEIDLAAIDDVASVTMIERMLGRP